MTRPATQSVVLRLPPPISQNMIWRSFIRNGKATTIKSKRYRDWLAQAGGMIADQNPGRIEGWYGIRIRVPAKTRIDLDNVPKAINDVLQHYGIIDNDSRCHNLHVERGSEDVTVVFLISTNGE